MKRYTPHTNKDFDVLPSFDPILWRVHRFHCDFARFEHAESFGHLKTLINRSLFKNFLIDSVKILNSGDGDERKTEDDNLPRRFENDWLRPAKVCQIGLKLFTKTLSLINSITLLHQLYTKIAFSLLNTLKYFVKE